MDVRPFTIHVPDDVLENIRQRLDQTRFPDEIPGSGGTTAVIWITSKHWSTTGARTSIGEPRRCGLTGWDGLGSPASLLGQAVMEHEQHPDECNQHKLVEQEMRYHSVKGSATQGNADWRVSAL